MQGLLGASFFVLCFLVATACSAATVQPVSGDVSVNRGQGFQNISGPFEAREGDIVMVSPGGSASVSYADGCKVSVQPGAVLTIAAVSPCASGSNTEEHDTQRFKLPLVFGAIVLGITGGVAYEAYRASQNNQPASP